MEDRCNMMSESQAAALHQLSLGNSFKEQGLLEDAVQCYQEGLSICPGSAKLWFNLGNTFIELSRLPKAAAALQQAIALKPDLSAYNNLGYVLKKQGLPKDAVHYYQKGLDHCPDDAQLWYNMGTTLIELSKLPEAVQALQQAIILNPDMAEAYTNLGNALIRLQRPSEAIDTLQRAITLKPDLADTYNNLGTALQFQGKVEKAIAAFDHAITLNPENPEIYNNRAQALLLSGNLSDGFAEYEWRTKINRFHHFFVWCDDKPRWCGENFSGKRLLVHHEQGYGDAIQFCRYLPMVKARGGIVQFSTRQPLLRLFTNLPGVDELIEYTSDAICGTQSDLTVPLMSLPHIFGTTLNTIPANIPYLTIDRSCIDLWHNKMNHHEPTIRVGLVWAGNPANNLGQIRTCGLRAMSPLANVPDTIFYSLQKDEAAKETTTPPAGMRLVDLTSDIEDFADTAALIMNLDLVISIDTAVAHLAGALGKPVWMLLPAAGEWRWLLDRKDTPWYPTMRLFRQTAPGDWAGVMTAVVQELRTLLSAKNPAAIAGV